MAAPTTPFENSEGVTFTSLEDEAIFLSAVVAESTRAAIFTVGTSAGGLPIRAVAVGAPVPARWDILSNIVLVVASQHGQEKSPREAALMAIRDLSFSSDPNDAARLTDTTIVFIPTANPEGTLAGTRANGNGVDINRDHLSLTQREARAIASVIKSTSPLFVYDGHEWGEAVLPINLAVGQGVARLPALQVGLDLKADIQAQYAGQVADYESINHEGTLQSVSALKGCPVMLVETGNFQPAHDRAQQHRELMLLSYRRMADNRAQTVSARDAAQLETAEEGALVHAPWYAADAPPIAPQSGYWIDRTEAAVATVLAQHGIELQDDPDSGHQVYVSTGQAFGGLVPLLLDKAAPRGITIGEPANTMGYAVGHGEPGYFPPDIVVGVASQKVSARMLITHLGNERRISWAR